MSVRSTKKTDRVQVPVSVRNAADPQYVTIFPSLFDQGLAGMGYGNDYGNFGPFPPIIFSFAVKTAYTAIGLLNKEWLVLSRSKVWGSFQPKVLSLVECKGETLDL